jgi:hypothetical protein
MHQRPPWVPGENGAVYLLGYLVLLNIMPLSARACFMRRVVNYVA